MSVFAVPAPPGGPEASHCRDPGPPGDLRVVGALEGANRGCQRRQSLMDA